MQENKKASLHPFIKREVNWLILTSLLHGSGVTVNISVNILFYMRMKDRLYDITHVIGKGNFLKVSIYLLTIISICYRHQIVNIFGLLFYAFRNLLIV